EQQHDKDRADQRELDRRGAVAVAGEPAMQPGAAGAPPQRPGAGMRIAHNTSAGEPLGTELLGKVSPASVQPPRARIEPPPLMRMLSKTRAMQFAPLVALLIAPLSVRLACGM